MPDPTVTPVDTGDLKLGYCQHRPDKIRFAALGTYKRGTLLGRKLISDTIAVTPDGGNTGDHALTAAAKPGRTLKAGTYVLLAGTLAVGLGPWTLTDPDGISETFSTAGGAATDDLSFPALGVQVTVTAGTTNFVTGDTADLDVAAETGTPLVPYSPTGTNGAQVPSQVLEAQYSRTTAGDLAASPIVDGEVNQNRLVIHEDGDASNITAAILDQLRFAGIVAHNVAQRASLES